VKDVYVNGDQVTVALRPAAQAGPARDRLVADVRSAVLAAGARAVDVQLFAAGTGGQPAGGGRAHPAWGCPVAAVGRSPARCRTCGT
jgi:hypothetical protein